MFCHKLLNPTNRKLISNQGTYPLVMLNLAVEFRTLFTHAKFRIRALADNIDCCFKILSPPEIVAVDRPNHAAFCPVPLPCPPRFSELGA